VSSSSIPLISHKEADVLALFSDCQADQKSIQKSRNRYQNEQYVSTQSPRTALGVDPPLISKILQFRSHPNPPLGLRPVMAHHMRPPFPGSEHRQL
jgi:hypothetical protein